MKRYSDILLALLGFLVGSTLVVFGATYSVGFGSGQGDSTFTFNDTSKQATAQSFAASAVAQTIGAGDTIAADSCGGLKAVSAAGSVTTDTTNTFTAPATANKGCVMQVCNTSANTITLDKNANFLSTGGADVALAQNKCLAVGSTGASGVWYQLTALQADS